MTTRSPFIIGICLLPIVLAIAFPAKVTPPANASAMVNPKLVYGAVLIKKGGAQIVDFSLFGNPFSDHAERFRAFHRRAIEMGYLSAYPNYEQADYGKGLVYGAVLIEQVAGDRIVRPGADVSSLQARFRAINRGRNSNKYAGVFPDFEQGMEGGTIVYGAIYLKQEYAERLVIDASDLGNPQSIDERFRAVNRWAIANGYAAGFPDFEERETQPSAPPVSTSPSRTLRIEPQKPSDCPSGTCFCYCSGRKKYYCAEKYSGTCAEACDFDKTCRP
jgi:hypothetical protein